MARIVKAVGNEWSPELIADYYKHLEDIAVGQWGYDVYPNQLEVVTSEGMLEAYASVGMPIMYPHWSFGKQFLDNQRDYKRGAMGLAYEMVINSKPCISYLMEENTLTMQILVIAHAAFGHNHFFKNNYMFQQWTQPDSIIDYLKFAREYVRWCEDKYGIDEVEEILDAAHSLMNYGVDKYKRRRKRKGEVAADRKRRQQWEQDTYDALLLKELDRLSPSTEAEDAFEDDDPTNIEPTENLLYFIEKHSPGLKEPQRELVRIVRKMGEYFYPQMLTKVGNEGCATFTHYMLGHALYDAGLVDDAFMQEFLHNHTNVVSQLPFNHPAYHGINPYKLGFEIFRDMKRICETPDQEDEYWFPTMVGKPFWPTFFQAVSDFKDESFVRQFLGPRVIRDMQLMSLVDKPGVSRHFEVSGVSTEEDFRHIRNALAETYEWPTRIPRIEVTDVDLDGDRCLKLTHHTHRGRLLDDETSMGVLEYVNILWGFPVHLTSITEDGRIVEQAHSG